MGTGHKLEFDDYVLNDPSAVIIYADQENTLSVDKDSFLNVKALMAIGNLNINGKDTGPAFDVLIPAGAEEQYAYKNEPDPPVTIPPDPKQAKIDDAKNAWTTTDYSPAGNDSFFSVGEGNMFPVKGLTVRGFLYAGKDFRTGSGNSVIAGLVYVKGKTSVNTLTLFYDKTIAEKIHLRADKISIISWHEIQLEW